MLHLAGSPTSDFWAELSRLYAADCLAATANSARLIGDSGADGLEAVLAWISPDGSWRFPTSLDPAAVDASPGLTLSEACARIADERIDVMLPQLFCPVGMTAYRALFDLLGIPYVGNHATAMGIGADKALARAVVAAAGVAVPKAVVVRAEDASRATELPPLPVVVKPIDADNSTGVSLVREAGQLETALAEAFRHADRALVEAFVPLGREVRCGVLDLGDGRGPVALPIEEYRVGADAGIRTFADKIAPAGDAGPALRLEAKSNDRAWIVAAGDPLCGPVAEAAIACHVALGCRDYGLFDFRVDPEGRPWFIEAGLYCSFAEQSVVVAMARAAGWTAAGLLEACVDAALQRGPRAT